jgi:hypothetical protein
VWQLCSKDYTKVNYYVQLKWIHIRLGTGTSLNKWRVEGGIAITNVKQYEIEILKRKIKSR